MLLGNIFKHFVLITKHKFYVFRNCCIAGLYWQGIIHDISKFHPVEFCESVKYYTGVESPLITCKRKNGYSKAYLHHMGVNKHHYEYWVQDFLNGGIAIQMPFKYALEMVCDRLAAGKVYMGDSFSYEAEYNWWKEKHNKETKIHQQTNLFFCLMMEEIIKENSLNVLRKNRAKLIYEKASELTNRY